MSEDSSTSQTSNDEIDLSAVFDKIKSFFKSLLIGIVQIFQFFWNHKIRLLILLIIGVGLQFLLMIQTKKIYVNEYLVITNFGSTEYLYSKVNSINAKLNSEDTLYLEKVFGEEYKRIKDLEVVPVVDVYNLVNKSEENREVFELLLDEYDDISFLEEEININEYPNHRLRVFIKGLQNNENISNRLYDFLSDNEFYNELKRSTLENLKLQLAENQLIRMQIDSIVKEQKGNKGFSNDDKNSIIFSGSQNLQELLNQKRVLLSSDLDISEQMTSKAEVLKIIDSSFGVLSKERNLNYFVIPVSLVVLYCLFFFAVYIRNRVQSFLKG